MNGWHNILSGGLSVDDVSPQTLRQIRNINFTIVIEIVVSIIFLWRNIQWEILPRVLGIGAGLSLAILCLFLFRRYRRPNLFGGCATLIAYLAITPGVYTSGGLAGEAILWLAVPPVLAGLLVNQKAIIVAILISCGIALHIAMLEWQGITLLSLTPVEHQMSQRVMQNVAVIIVLGSISYGYLRHLHDAQHHLEESLKKLEQEVEQRKTAEQEATESHRQKNQFFANMSHELRTPLNAILGFSAQLTDKLESLSTERLKKSLLSIHRNAAHLKLLINDLFDLSQAKSSSLSITQRSVDLHDLVAGIADDLYGSADQESLTLVVDLQSNLIVKGDPLRLSQVFFNLIDNAIKYTRKGNISITSTKSNQEHVVIEFIDEGDGLSAEDQAKILNPYDHLMNPFSQNSSTTALGLPLTKKLVELHNGKLELESRLGEGSTFRVILPKGA